jgi:hypothetical protein
MRTTASRRKSLAQSLSSDGFTLSAGDRSQAGRHDSKRFGDPIPDDYQDLPNPLFRIRRIDEVESPLSAGARSGIKP